VPRPPADPSRPDSRARLLAAARAEFAARGFAGASVDRIAARARLTKAMIYYHFQGKEGLYRAVLQEVFAAVGERTRHLRESTAAPADRLREFVAAFAGELIARPDFPHVMFREALESGRHLDAATVAAMLVVPGTFLAILDQGVRQGHFRPVAPLLAYFSVVGPIVMALAGAPARARIARFGGRLPDVPARDALVAAMQDLAIASLCRPPRAPATSRKVVS